MQVVTANRLTDGLVVYLTAGFDWSGAIAEAGIARGDADGERLLAEAGKAVSARLVVDPYLIDVAEVVGGIAPLRYREVIRATGPSIETVGG